MKNIIPLPEKQLGYTQNATVQGGSNGKFMVLTNRGVESAEVAFSCLITPQAGDRVLLNSNQQSHHILAILDRTGNNDVHVNFPANATLSAKQGKLNLSSKEGIKLSTAGKTELLSRTLSIIAIEASAHLASLKASGNKLSSQWKEVRTISDAIHLVANRVTEQIKNSYRYIEGVDQQSSLNFLQTVRKTLSIRSHHAMITSRGDIKIDGERIHMG